MSTKSINCKGILLDLSTPKIMGILNFTENSFYDGGKYNSIKQALIQVEKMLIDGADIIDIGVISSKPGSTSLSEKEETEHLSPLFKELNKNFKNVIFSLDTFRANIANKFINDHNVSIINDISAGELDENMFSTISKLNIPYIIMHMQGTPETMQKEPIYNKNIEIEILEYFAKKTHHLKSLGVNDVIIDPGFGFGKTLEHNYQLLNGLNALRITELPILVGLSRKSMINKLLNISPSEALNGTTAVNTIALQNGANILRVHDVKEAKQVVNIYNALHEIRIYN